MAVRLFATLAALASSARALAALIDLSGSWVLAANYVEDYTITPTTSSTSFHVACVAGRCSAWRTAVVVVVDEGTGACTVAFSSGVNHTGVVAPGVESITWSDGSTWSRQVPPGTTLDVHLLPHSHNDPGWKSTCAELYNASVRTIYTELVTHLALNPARTYAAEIAVFWALWWEDPLVNATTRALARAAVASGQMEFFGGGYTQNDEAAARFEDTVDNMALGHLWAQSALGSPPVTSAWQADPFGHSTTQAFLYSRLAMDGFVFGRPMQNDPVTTTQSAALWHPTTSFPDGGSFDTSTVLTHDHFVGYWEPYRDLHGALAGSNVTVVAAGLAATIATLAARAPPLRTQVVLFGDDFAWFDANLVYPTLDAALLALNGTNTSNGLTVNIQYSTPSRWLAALAQEVGAARGAAPRPVPSPSAYRAPPNPFPGFPARPAWDMMPLIGCEFPAPWTGFYTSRPEFKGKFRAASAALRAANQLHSLARDADAWLTHAAMLGVLWRAVSLVQHHDAITGDSFDYVMEDFGTAIDGGMGNASVVMGQAVGVLSGASAPPQPCFNTSSLPCGEVVAALSSGGSVHVTVYNPLGWVRGEWVELVLPLPRVVVTDVATGVATPSQTVATVPGWVPPVYGSGPWYTLLFKAVDLPPLGYRVYTLSPAPTPAAPGASTLCTRGAGGPAGPPAGWTTTVTLPSTPVSMTFNGSGVLTSFAYSGGGPALAAVATPRVYTSTPGAENAWDFTTQGRGQESAQAFPGADGAAFTVTDPSCPLFAEVVTETDPSNGVRTRYRLLSGGEEVHAFTTTGPFTNAPVNVSHDAILRVETNVSSATVFYTDSNGLELLRRVRDGRPWWNGTYVDESDPVTSNVYPVTAAIAVRDAETDTSLFLLCGSATGLGSSQGGTSMRDGVVEVGVNRAVLDGSSNPVTGNRAVTVHNVLLARSSWADGTAAFRAMDTGLANPVVLLASSSPAPPTRPTWAGLRTPLPPSLQLLTLQTLPPGANVTSVPTSPPPPLSSAVVALRVRHVLAAGEGRPAASAQTVDLDMFTPWATVGATETTLSLTRQMAAARAEQIVWPQEGEGAAEGGRRAHVQAAAADTSVTLLPLDIKTFTVTCA